MTAADSLLRAVCERPFDDGPRLIYGDWLDEHGEPERAEFVRVQISECRCPFPGSHPSCERCEYVNQHLLYGGLDKELNQAFSLNDSWGLRALKVHNSESSLIGRSSQIEVTFRRGWPSAVSLSLRQLLRGPCEQCEGTKYIDRECDVCGNTADEDGSIEHGRGCYVANEDGGGSTSCEECPDCHGTGRSPGLAPALAKWPITEVLISDAVIHASGGNDTYYLGGLGSFPKEYWRRLEDHRSRQDVRTAVSQVSVDFIRSQSTPPLPGIRWERDTNNPAPTHAGTGH